MPRHGLRGTPMKQIPLAIGPEPLPTFDSFIAGANDAALAHLRSAVATSAPTYLWGGAGCGKTHLLRALMHESHRRGENIGYFDADEPAPWTVREDCTLVVVDRCEALDDARQQAAFACAGTGPDRRTAGPCSANARRPAAASSVPNAATSRKPRRRPRCEF
jgi:hypothetical protein